MSRCCLPHNSALIGKISYSPKQNSAVSSAVKLGPVHNDKHPIKKLYHGILNKYMVNFLSVSIA